MKKTIIILLILIVSIFLNSLYFEYCVSRALPIFLTIIATIAIILLDIFVFVYTVKTIKQLLKL